MNVQSWQLGCPRCGWANSGANDKCAKCGWPLDRAPGMLVAGQRQGARSARPAPTKVVRPGGVLPRLIAWIIDVMILLVIVLPLYFLWVAQLTPIKVDPNTNFALEQFKQRAYFEVGIFVLRLFYFVGSWTILAASPGMTVMNLRLIDKSGQGVGFGRALMRYIVLDFIIPITLVGPVISFFMIALGKSKRGLHDLLAGTFVVQLLEPGPAVAGETPAAATPAQAVAVPISQLAVPPPLHPSSQVAQPPLNPAQGGIYSPPVAPSFPAEPEPAAAASVAPPAVEPAPAGAAPPDSTPDERYSPPPAPPVPLPISGDAYPMPFIPAPPAKQPAAPAEPEEPAVESSS